VQYFVFDIETVADGDLIARVRYTDKDGNRPNAVDAIQRYRDELMEQYNNDFIPYTFQRPISVVVGKVDSHLRLIDVVALDEPNYRPHMMTELFWRGWESYKHPTLVSFNGRSFDLPVLELSAFDYGISLPNWFFLDGRSFEQPRNRYNSKAHLDLHDILTNYGATRFNGGLNLAANILGKPGKMSVQGCEVQDMYNRGEIEEINDYCRCDVLDTYFVFLRTSVLTGEITFEHEQELVHQAKEWIEKHVSEFPTYEKYLNNWGDWKNPWAQSENNTDTQTETIDTNQTGESNEAISEELESEST